MTEDELLNKLKHMYRPSENGCWIWIDKTWSNGRYGYIKHKNKTISAHRFFCQLKNGKPPKGAFCCHKCNITLCVNPDHLYWGNAKTNYHDSANQINQNLKNNWGCFGYSNPNCKLNKEEYIKRQELARKLRAEGFSYREIKIKLGLKSKGHARKICLS